MYTEATENYLRSIYELQECYIPVTTGALAARLAVRPPSVTNMLKRLAALNLVVYNPYHAVVLTAAGEAVARRLLRSHRLIECYLSVVFKLPFDQVQEAADKWEHALSPDVVQRIDESLGHPSNNAHGAPIPDGMPEDLQTAVV
jgi:DtxR family Mn-dependent transcriptional regulator